MIDLTGMISIPYLKKTTFTGSEKGTNFMIRKISGEEGEPDKIQAITGKRPDLFRAPYGDYDNALLETVETMQMYCLQWDVDSLDWKLRNQKRIVKKVLKEAEDGDIILMHDIFDTSVSAALELIDILQREGYTFVTADELMID